MNEAKEALTKALADVAEALPVSRQPEQAAVTVQVRQGRSVRYGAIAAALLAACRSGSPAPARCYVTLRQAQGWAGNDQAAHKLARG